MHGWTPKTIMLGPDGEVISVSVTESRFTPREVALLLAARREQNASRSSTGIKLAEATDPANADAFTVPLPVIDFAAKKLRREQDAYEKQWGKEAMHDLLWRVQMRD